MFVMTIGLGFQYTQRRDFFVDCLADEFHLQILPGTAGVWSGSDVYGASLKPKRGIVFREKSNPTARTLFSFVPPTAGMFVWVCATRIVSFPSTDLMSFS